MVCDVAPSCCWCYLLAVVSCQVLVVVSVVIAYTRYVLADLVVLVIVVLYVHVVVEEVVADVDVVVAISVVISVEVDVAVVVALDVVVVNYASNAGKGNV